MRNKSNYENIKIPENLHTVVQNAISEGLCSQATEKKFSLLKRIGCTAAAVILCFTTLLNVSPVFAAAAYRVPILGSICRILTFREYHFEDNVKYIDAKIPKIDNTGKDELEKRVNLEIQKTIQQRLAENETRAKEYYDAFVETGGDPKEFTPVGITVDYEIKKISNQYVSFVVSQYETYFSAYHYNYFYNIDLESGRILTIKDWFGDEYQQIIADSIEKTISGWDDDQKAFLWEDVSILDQISENTDFYIDEADQIVVVFDKYDIAAGAAGMLEFTISTVDKEVSP